jgi:truncated hemoglobin YjbI
MTMTTCADVCSPAETEAISIYQAIGGRASVTAAVDRFYRRLLADPALAPFFPGGVGARHRAYLVTILGEALGSPAQRFERTACTDATAEQIPVACLGRHRRLFGRHKG